jgi:hypothetical protein
MPSPKNKPSVKNSRTDWLTSFLRWVWWPVVTLVVAVYGYTLWVFLANAGDSLIVIAPQDQVASFAESIAALGMDAGTFLFLFLLPEIIVAIVFVVVGLLIRLRSQRDWFGLFTSLWMLFFGLSATSTFTDFYVPPSLYPLIYFGIYFAYFGVVLFLLTYPDGKFQPRWIVAVLVSWAIFILATLVGTWWDWNGPQGALVLVPLMGFMLYAQVYRFRKVSTTAQREQTKWLIFALIANLVIVLVTGLTAPAPDAGGSAAAVYSLAANAFEYFGNLLFVLAVGIAILRYRLWDIEVVVNRALIYAPLSLILAGIFAVSAVLINESTQQLFGAEDASTSAVVSALVVATVFTPLRGRIEKWINRNLYADNSNLARDLVELSPDMRNLLSQKELAHVVAERVSKLLDSKAVGFYERAGSAYRLLAAAKGDQELSAPSISKKEQSSLEAGRVLGTSVSGLTIPLYVPRLRSKEVVGVMQVGLRKNGRGYSSDDKRALVELGGEVGTALYAVKLRTRKR